MGRDANDVFTEHGKEAVRDALGRASRPTQGSGLAFRAGISARALMEKQFSPIRWIVNGYLVEGMTLLAGAPKACKSWLCLNWLIAVASGGYAMGSVLCEQGDVLGLMLEDNQRRLKRRIAQMGVAIPDRVTLVDQSADWPTLDNGCVEEIEAWIDGVENPRLIVIDVFARVKGSKRQQETDYDSDYRQAAKLQAIASRHNLSIVVVHHTRKAPSDNDPFDEVSGTRGLTGASDAIVILKKKDGQHIIYGRGRDLEEIETALQFDKSTGLFTILGDAWQVADTVERRQIQEFLGRSVDPLTPTEIAEATGKSRQTVQNMLSKMYADGQVEKISRGRYVLVSSVSNVSQASSLIETKDTKETDLHARVSGAS